MLEPRFFDDRESLLQQNEVDWAAALSNLRVTIDREVLAPANALSISLFQQQLVMSDIATASTKVAETRSKQAERTVEVARRSAESNIALLTALLTVDVKSLLADSIPRHLKALKRFQAAIDSDIERMNAGAGVIQDD